VQGEAYDWPEGLFEERVHKVYRRRADPDAIRAAADSIAASSRPIIISGGGVRYSRAEESLRQLTDATGIPVGETYAGRGTARECGTVAGGLGIIGSASANTLAAEADLIVAVGTRLADTVTGSHSAFKDPDASFVAVNVSQIDLVKNFALQVDGDARVVLDDLVEELGRRDWQAPAKWRERAGAVVDGWKTDLAASLETHHSPMRGYEVVDELDNFANADDRVVVTSSTAIGYAHAMWSSPAELDLEYGYSCMGYEIPGALGHRFARAEGDCYTILGDGTYLMGYPGEFVTAIQERQRFTAILLVNSGWQCINRFEQGAIGRTYGTQFKMKADNGEYAGETLDIDYTANAAALGCTVFDVRSREEFRAALEKTRTGDVPILIAAHVVDDDIEIPAGVWWDFGSAEVDVDGQVPDRHTKHVEGGSTQRWYV
jgi:3D-(3,5/4)-trihydroxycyclohexane-1,2-dione acylhydrolase (decyclizing)